VATDSSLAIWLVTDVRTEESHQPHEQASLPLLSLQILSLKLLHPLVVQLHRRIIGESPVEGYINMLKSGMDLGILCKLP
jgi:hypothetical protein